MRTRTQDKVKENLGEFMLRMIKRAIKIAQKEAAIFSSIAKEHYNKVDDDLVTSADLKIQAFHVPEIRNWDPEGGLIGEEKALRVEPTEGFALGQYFTDDPVDGTKAYGRKQSSGVSSMLAHVAKGKVDAVCIGDINTGEIYQFAPDIPPTRTRFGVKTPLQPNVADGLGKLYVVLKDHPEDFPIVVQKMIRKEKGGLLKDIEVTSGSIGLLVARLWKGEIGMIITRPGHDTPWDTTPLIGMNTVLGIKHLKLDPKTLEITMFEPELPLEVIKKNYVEILVHETRVEGIIEWIEKNR